MASYYIVSQNVTQKQKHYTLEHEETNQSDTTYHTLSHSQSSPWITYPEKYGSMVRLKQNTSDLELFYQQKEEYKGMRCI